MRDNELDGLMQLGLTKKDIKPWRAKTGIQYRIKVRNETGRLVYITDLRSQKKQNLIAKNSQGSVLRFLSLVSTAGGMTLTTSRRSSLQQSSK